MDADALDHAAAQVALDAGQAGRRRHLEERRPELQAVVAVVVPAAPRVDGLAWLYHRCGADERHQLAPAPRLDPEHAEAGVGVVKGHPLDQPGKCLGVLLVVVHWGWSPARLASGVVSDSSAGLDDET